MKTKIETSDIKMGGYQTAILMETTEGEWLGIICRRPEDKHTTTPWQAFAYKQGENRDLPGWQGPLFLGSWFGQDGKAKAEKAVLDYHGVPAIRRKDGSRPPGQRTDEKRGEGTQEDEKAHRGPKEAI